MTSTQVMNEHSRKKSFVHELKSFLIARREIDFLYLCFIAFIKRQTSITIYNFEIDCLVARSYKAIRIYKL